MLLSITTTHQPATDLGYLLAKNPARVHDVSLAFGRALVFYPEATRERCTAALLLEVDPVGLTRRTGADAPPLAPYVNDRPYVCSSFLSVALARSFSTAMGGRSRERPELAGQAIPLEATLHCVPCRGGEALVRSLFEPLGYAVDVERQVLDPAFPAWGQSRYYRVRISHAGARLADLLSHLYVLIPVLDEEKHYWVGHDEIDKLLAHGEGWLAAHPQREQIASRYLRRQGYLVSALMAQLMGSEEAEIEVVESAGGADEQNLEKPIRLNDQRMGTVLDALRSRGVSSVADIGCGEGRLLRDLWKEKSFTRVLGMDVSAVALSRAAERLNVDRMNERQRERLALVQGSLTYRDDRLKGYDAACAVEVIEHLEPSRLHAFEQVLFAHPDFRVVIVTTPNAEYNVRFPGLPAGAFRHRDHRFEWTREQFRTWADRVASTHGYAVTYEPVGEVDPQVGAPTQMAIFTRHGKDEVSA